MTKPNSNVEKADNDPAKMSLDGNVNDDNPEDAFLQESRMNFNYMLDCIEADAQVHQQSNEDASGELEPLFDSIDGLIDFDFEFAALPSSNSGEMNQTTAVVARHSNDLDESSTMEPVQTAAVAACQSNELDKPSTMETALTTAVDTCQLNELGSNTMNMNQTAAVDTFEINELGSNTMNMNQTAAVDTFESNELGRNAIDLNQTTATSRFSEGPYQMEADQSAAHAHVDFPQPPAPPFYTQPLSYMQLAQSNLDLSQSNLDLAQSNLNLAQSNLNLAKSNLQPGQSNMQPGQSNLQPGQSNMQPGQSNLQPGQSNMQPGQSNLQPGQSNLQPGQSNTQAQSTSDSPTAADDQTQPTSQANVKAAPRKRKRSNMQPGQSNAQTQSTSDSPTAADDQTQPTSQANVKAAPKKRKTSKTAVAADKGKKKSSPRPAKSQIQSSTTGSITDYASHPTLGLARLPTPFNFPLPGMPPMPAQPLPSGLVVQPPPRPADQPLPAPSLENYFAPHLQHAPGIFYPPSAFPTVEELKVILGCEDEDE